jgi:hypothetical protein
LRDLSSAKLCNLDATPGRIGLGLNGTLELKNMDKEKLHQELERLHVELQQIDSLDASDREKLLTLAEEIRQLLEYKGTDTRHYRSLLDRVEGAVTEFEAAHPRTTQLMRDVLHQIAYLGI